MNAIYNSRVLTTPDSHKMRIHEVGWITYVWAADAGSDENETVWRIIRISNNDTQIDHPNGEAEFKYKWTEHESYTYN